MRAIPDEVVVPPAGTDARGRRGPAPPPPPDVLGPVLRVLILARPRDRPAPERAARAALARHRLGRAAHPRAQHFVRGEHSADGKSDLSTRRSVPMADRLRASSTAWSRRTAYGGRRRPRLRPPATRQAARPQQGHQALQGRLPRRGRPRPCASTTCATPSPPAWPPPGQPLRTIQEFLGHADSKTTQIYAHYAPSEHEVEMVNHAFAPAPRGTIQGTN